MPICYNSNGIQMYRDIFSSLKHSFISSLFYLLISIITSFGIKIVFPRIHIIVKQITKLLHAYFMVFNFSLTYVVYSPKNISSPLVDSKAPRDSHLRPARLIKRDRRTVINVINNSSVLSLRESRCSLVSRRKALHCATLVSSTIQVRILVLGRGR